MFFRDSVSQEDRQKIIIDCAQSMIDSGRIFYQEKKYTLYTGIWRQDKENIDWQKFYVEIHSNSVEFLEAYWKETFARNFDTTTWHFIVDNETKKCERVLSCC